MKQKINAFEIVIDGLRNSLSSITDFETKPSETSWSKKEILGHLIDSAINNLQRFTEIQYAEKPYIIRPYDQNELVKGNNYQDKEVSDLLNLLIALNQHVLYVVSNQTEGILHYQIVLPNKTETDLKFVIEDYFEHFYHHLNQITEK